MGRTTKKKAPYSRDPAQIQGASEARLLQALSKPKSWAESGMKYRALRINPRRRGRISVTAGLFDLLPTEISEMILLDLDYPSLATLCGVNSKVESFIKNRPFYKLVVEYCHNTLQEMKKRDLIRVHNARQVYRALINPKCSGPGCQRLGNSLFLPNCRRSCIHCLGYTPLLSAMLLEGAEEKYELHAKDIIENVTCFKLPRENGIFVLEVETAKLAIRLHGEKPVAPTCTPAWSEEAVVPFPFLNPTSGNLEFGRQCRACYLRFKEHESLWCETEIEPSDEELAYWERDRRRLKELGLAFLGRKQLLEHITSGECLEAPKLWSREVRKN
jgi:hypothetical protein